MDSRILSNGEPGDQARGAVQGIKSIFSGIQNQNRKNLTEWESKEVLRLCGIPTTGGAAARTADEAAAIADQMGYPVAIKILSPDILHKSDVQGVRVGLVGPESVRQAFDEVTTSAGVHRPDAEILGVLVQESAPPPTAEVVVGAAIDPVFGHVLMFGLGGVFVELLKDVAFRVAPITEIDAREMIQEIKGHPLLSGFRGSSAADISSLAKVILKASWLVTEFESEIAEMDFNPIFAYPSGCKVVDARIVLR